MARVFVSYRHETLAGNVARQLTQSLATAGHDAFMDDKIRPGQKKFDEFIAEQIRLCEAFIVLVTRSAQDSEWVLAEVQMATELANQHGRPLVIPLVLEKFSPWRLMWNALLAMLQHVHCLDLDRDWPAAQARILAELDMLRPTSPLPAPETTPPPQGVPPSTLRFLESNLHGAEEEIARGNFQSASTFLGPCLEEVERTGEQVPAGYRIRLFNNLALVLAYRGSAPQAMAYAVKARDLLASHDDPVLRAHNAHRLGFLSLQQHEVFDALKHLEQAEKLARSHNLLALRGQILDTLGKAWVELGFVETAIDYYLSSLKIKAEVKDDYGQAISHGNLGRAYQQQGQLALARQHFEEDLELSRKLGDLRGVMLMRSHLAGLLRDELRYRESLDAYRDYLRRAEEDRMVDHVAFGHLGLARVKGTLGQAREAERHLGQAWEFAASARWFEPMVLRASGELASQKGELDEAVFFYRKALNLLEQGVGQAQDLVETLCELGQLEARRGQTDPATACVERALEIAQHARLRWMMARLRGVQARLSRHGGGLTCEADMPLPLVLATKRVDGTFSPVERLEAMIELFKVALRYVTSAALAQYQVIRGKLAEAETDEALSRIFDHRSPSYGLWAQALRTVVQALARHMEQVAFPRIVEVCMKKVRDHYRLRGDMQEHISTLLHVRNQISHARRPTPTEAQELLGTVEEAGVRFLEALRPLWTYRLLACQQQESAFRCRELTGVSSLVSWPAHVGVPPASVVDGEVLLWNPESGKCLSLAPWWLVRWRDDPDTRGDLYLFFKRSHGQTIHVHVETRQELRVPAGRGEAPSETLDTTDDG